MQDDSSLSQKDQSKGISLQRKNYLIRKLNQIKLIQYFTKAKKHIPLELHAVNEQSENRLGDGIRTKVETSNRSLKSIRPVSKRVIEVSTPRPGHAKGFSSNLEIPEGIRATVPPTRVPSGRKSSEPQRDNSEPQAVSTRVDRGHKKLKTLFKPDAITSSQYQTVLMSKASTERQLIAVNEKYELLHISHGKTHRNQNSSVDSHKLFSRKKPMQIVTGLDAPYKRKISVSGGVLRF